MKLSRREPLVTGLLVRQRSITMTLLCAGGFVVIALFAGAQNGSRAVQDGQVPESASYTTDGSLRVPVRYREWVYLTSGIDMSYTAATADAGHSMFDNVFVNPASYRSFLATGTWPDKTTMVLEVRGAESPVSINKRGHTQSSEVMGMEIHVKDHGVWSFYERDGGSVVAKLIPRPASCYSCHEQHAAVDTTFVQFYPTLLPLAKDKKTLSAEYLKQAAKPVGPVAIEPAAKYGK